jgi:adenine phosphoribosyltransferase
MDLKSLIREVPDFPKPGIVFCDLTTLFKDPKGWQYLIDLMAEQVSEIKADFIVGIESRGFILGAPLAYKLDLGFIPVRKPGKLPAPVYGMEYELEYGSDRVEMHQDALSAGQNALIVDDLMATGGTAAATAKLVEQTQANLSGFAFVVELPFLKGREKLPEVPIISLLEY